MSILARRPTTQLVLLVAAAATVLSVLASRVRDWVVMTDEMQYAKLATSFAHGDVLPTLRGVRVSAYAQLYPALLSPFYGLLAAPSAFRAAHVLNGILMATTGVAGYFLAREATLSPRWSLLAAALTVAVPWTLLSAFVMTESAAYPAFVLAMLASLRALTAPTPRRDVVALVAIALAVLARTQFLALAIVLPVAALVVDRRAALDRHRVLAGGCLAGVVVAAILRTRLLGSYAVAASDRSIVSWRMLEQAGAHLDVAALGVALLPLLIGGAWIVDAAWRRQPFGVLALVTIVVVTLEASSFDARFGGGLAGIRGRYVFYVVPLLLVGMLLSLSRRELPGAALAGVTAFVAVTVLAHGFPVVAGVYVDAPEAVVNDVVHASGGRVFVALLAIVLALVFARLPWRLLVPFAVALVALTSVATAARAWGRLLTAHGPSGRLVAHPPDVVYDWVDRSLPDGADAAMLPYPVHPEWAPSAIFWWDVEFWNSDVDRAYVIGDTWEYAPFPNRELRVDPRTGVVAGTSGAPAYLVTSVSDARVHVAGTRVAYNYGLDVRAVPRPWRADWMTTGLDADGWTRPGRLAAVRIFAPRGQSVRVALGLATPANHVSVVRRNDVCVPAVGSAKVAIPFRAAGEAPPLPLAPGSPASSRVVGARVTSIDVVASGRGCV